MDCRGISAFTRVFDALCPAMTESAENGLVPQGGFEPSTYRLRSDCSAVELLRRPGRALYQTSIKQAARCRRGAISPFVPAKAGTQSKRLDSRFRGNERWKVLGGVALSGINTTAGTARGCGSSRRTGALPARARVRL